MFNQITVHHPTTGSEKGSFRHLVDVRLPLGRPEKWSTGAWNGHRIRPRVHGHHGHHQSWPNRGPCEIPLGYPWVFDFFSFQHSLAVYWRDVIDVIDPVQVLNIANDLPNLHLTFFAAAKTIGVVRPIITQHKKPLSESWTLFAHSFQGS